MKPPTRILFDTNPYDFFLEEKELSRLLDAIDHNRVIVYGFKLTRQELRDIPPTIKHGKKNFRILILETYDKIVAGRFYKLTPLVEMLAKEYLHEYMGTCSDKELWNDFLIVACATLHRLDILVTNDRKTMRSKDALSAYEKVNKRNKFEMPKFLDVEEFKKTL